jgi:sRNA-binding carbon storage regulator CsrA
MLILSRYEDESAVIDLRSVGLGLIEVVVVGLRSNSVRLGFRADGSIPVDRYEIFWERERERLGDSRGHPGGA